MKNVTAKLKSFAMIATVVATMLAIPMLVAGCKKEEPTPAQAIDKAAGDMKDAAKEAKKAADDIKKAE